MCFRGYNIILGLISRTQTLVVADNFIYLFICGLLNDTESSSDYVVSDSRMLTDKELQSIWKNVWPILRYYIGICLCGARKNYGKLLSGQSVPRPIFEPRISRTEARRVTPFGSERSCRVFHWNCIQIVYMEFVRAATDIFLPYINLSMNYHIVMMMMTMIIINLTERALICVTFLILIQ
jgi:hypothetical protein